MSNQCFGFGNTFIDCFCCASRKQMFHKQWQINSTRKQIQTTTTNELFGFENKIDWIAGNWNCLFAVFFFFLFIFFNTIRTSKNINENNIAFHDGSKSHWQMPFFNECAQWFLASRWIISNNFLLKYLEIIPIAWLSTGRVF